MNFQIANYSTEISVLLLAVVLGLIHLGAQALISDIERGIKWALSPRDETKPLSQTGARLERASKNYQETFPFMAAILLIIELTHKSSELTRNLALIWLACRALYLPSYAYGWAIRSWVWIIALCVMIIAAISLFFAS